MIIFEVVQALVLVGTIIVIWKQVSTARNAQRAWVMTEIEHDTKKWADGKVHVLQGSGSGGETTALYAVLVCKNEGNSPAWIDEKRVKFEIVNSLPHKPNLESAEFIKAGPIPIGTGRALTHTDALQFQPVAAGRQQDERMAVIYGIVRYRDIFGKHRETTFGYRIADGEIRRLEGYPEYNKNT
jgi:hypothetical protein